MIEVIRHTSDFKQFASSFYMDSSAIIPDTLYAATATGSQPLPADVVAAAATALLQIPSRHDEEAGDAKTKAKRPIKKPKHGSKLICTDWHESVKFEYQTLWGSKSTKLPTSELALLLLSWLGFIPFRENAR